MTPSHYQQAIFDFVKSSQENGLVEAVAGSGKTTTIVEASKQLPAFFSGAKGTSLLDSFAESKNSLFVAFNKHIAEALASRLPASCSAQTLHSLGFYICRSQLGTKKLDQYKASKILTELGLPDPWKLTDKKEKARAFSLRSSAEAMISIAKSTLAKAEELKDVCDFYNIEVADPVLLETVPKALEKAQLSTETCDFDDMFWLPLVNSCCFPSFSTVFVDEAQDLSLAQFEFIKRLESRTLAVGDRNQSLYGFRGANPAAMDAFRDGCKAREFPLSISYRCPRAVIELARTLVPQIEAWEKAEEGLVENIGKTKFTELVKLNDMVICRFNSPLVAFALALIKKRVKVTIRGRDIGKNIAKFSEKFFRGNGQSFKDALLELKQYYETEVSKPGTKEKKQNLFDKVQICQLFATEVAKKNGKTDEVPKEIEALFSDDSSAVTLSSIHRAKGLEADRVFLLQTEDPFADQRQEWEEVQEKNCKYVAYTRAKRELYLVSED